MMNVPKEKALMTERMHERLYAWLDEVYIQRHEEKVIVTWAAQFVSHLNVLNHIEKPFDVGDGLYFVGYHEVVCPPVAPIITYRRKTAARRTGALAFEFAYEDGRPAFEALMVSTWDEDTDDLTLAAVPEAYVGCWLRFEDECVRVNGAVTPLEDEVYVVGGVDASFKTGVRWEDIHLDADLKEVILEDVDSFFDKGVGIYKRLNLKPFRKLLLAGVPGTGKTMLCGALANWALGQGYFVVYISGSNMHGNEFWKIHEGLEVAARAERPTVVIVEELDAYLQSHSKAQMLNVLDGSETPMNDYGTLLLSTTNHPEKIDDRIMKRPGRLDRIFIIPEVEDEGVGLAMLKQYLGDLWQEEHAEVVPDLMGRPAAFIREVALYALTRTAYQQKTALDLATLEESLASLVEQIESKDNFLTSHKQREMGLVGLGGRASERRAYRGKRV